MTDFTQTRQMFDIPDGMIYLNGNSLGPMPVAAPEKMTAFLRDEWRTELIKGWNTKGWWMQTNELGDRIARLIGAAPGTTVVSDTLSIKVFQAVSAGLAMVPDRKVILSDNGNFPTDLYMVEGLMRLKDDGYALRLPDPQDVLDNITDDVAVVMITEVDYRNGCRHDMKAIIEKAHHHGAVVVWDLAHSAGAIPVDLAGSDVDFAVGCTYKYINGGPGSPAFIYVAPRLLDTVEPFLSGWYGHESPFTFDTDFRPVPGQITRMRIGTPSIASFNLLSTALDVWDQVDMDDVHARAVELSDLFITQVEARCPGVTMASPRDPNQRGSHIAFRFEHGYACMQALISQGVIGDFRAPDIMRFGITPLFINEDDILKAAAVLEDILKNETWKEDRFQVRGQVT
ncbi:kynureninase [Pseudooctadecabacter sp.]|uniref:kynureninase n=1 Tax=Pseudooctadecabacter sp. TaxID=1966338 RepID=UPI0035C7B307